MDAIRVGIPVISHAVSSRGYEGLVQKGIVLVYDSVESFKSAVDRLVKIKVERNEMLNIYEKNFSFESGRNRLIGILEQEDHL